MLRINKLRVIRRLFGSLRSGCFKRSSQSLVLLVEEFIIMWFACVTNVVELVCNILFLKLFERFNDFVRVRNDTA